MASHEPSPTTRVSGAESNSHMWNGSDSDQLKIIMDTVVNIKRNQDSIRRSIDSKLDKLRSEMKETIDTRIRASRDELSSDMARDSSRLDQVVTTIQSLQLRMDTLENTTGQRNGTSTSHDTGYGQRQNINKLNDPNLTITASGILYNEGENILKIAQDLIEAMGADVSNNILVTGAIRLPTRFTNRPALVKIAFQNLDEKILVLRNKMVLKDLEAYKKHLLEKLQVSH
ncbi:hypothetical protein DPMN_062310 [Dreissena polymorpha]|uniref:Uncharacterized protein n=1 Tax=Dreissena polymorpha TaxID=45954 RepID=A0A9D4C9L8_DREPO|nr:hypothetical protein DPMN_062310 [Dreissena polymorpha]